MDGAKGLLENIEILYAKRCFPISEEINGAPEFGLSS